MSNITNCTKFAYAMNTIDGGFSMTNQPLASCLLRQAIYEVIDTENRINKKDGLLNIEKITVFVPGKTPNK